MKKLRITVDGHTYDVTVESLDESTPHPTAHPPTPASAHVAPPTTSAAPPPAPAASSAAAAGAVVSPLAGRVTSIDCKQGQRVEAGANLITVEAMKMFMAVTAPSTGSITSVLVNVGDAVEEGQVLLTLQ